MRLSVACAAVAVAITVYSGPVFAEGPEAGEKAFKKHYMACHMIEAGKNRVGPTLNAVMDRKAGPVPGFKYSDANAKSGAVFDEKYLDTYLTEPKAAIPGTKMVFVGVKNEQERKALIEYLKSAR